MKCPKTESGRHSWLIEGPRAQCRHCDYLRKSTAREQRRAKKNWKAISTSITRCLELSHGNVSKAARLVDVPLRTFYNAMKRCEINPDQYRPEGYRYSDGYFGATHLKKSPLDNSSQKS